MTNEGLFEDIFGFTTSCHKSKEWFVKEYYDISEEHWDRILSASHLFAGNGIGPAVICAEYDQVSLCGSITYDRVDVLQDIYHKNEMEKSEVVSAVRKVVKKMHGLGYGHGDLHLGNIGMKNGKYLILDHDTVYKSDKETTWLKRWMKEAFCFVNPTLKNFLRYDLINWTHQM